MMKTTKEKSYDGPVGFDAVGVVALWCFALVLMLGSCGRGSGLSVAGTYVSHESGEYSISKDTLLILVAGGEHNYQLIRRSGFQRIREGKLQPEEIKVQEFTGQFDPESLVMRLDGEDKQIRFFAGGNSLLLAKREYQKVINP
ncbi:hypothetical protein [Pedobacter psychroterrae]|uniref:Uncharacterized protein n=1 Tax=Pedobacter psychroterrae TaxID=2530453 RepID=A0A4R0NSQ4_9SPHI|nr:hypothetical protein [Pedobacter psychroterrae]TCD03169.1 hypothetical protein EZ437_04125 [Pedobacter psychroterrae]